jgi:hypothetical protein
MFFCTTSCGALLLLAEQLAFDGSSPLVRAAVLQGLQLLVDNTHAQPVLKVRDSAPARQVPIRHALQHATGSK